MIKKMIRLNREDFLQSFYLLGGAFALLELVIAGVMVILKPEGGILIAGVFLLTLHVIFQVAISLSNVMITYTQAITFSQSRRRALGGALGLSAVQAMFSLALVALFALTERHLMPHLWQNLAGATGYEIASGGYVFYRNVTGASPLLLDQFSLSWVAFPALTAIGCAAGIILGTVLLRFGSKGGWTLWAAWMVFMLVFQRLPWKTHTVTNWLIPALLLALLAGLAWSVRCLLRIPVKS